MPTGRHCDNGQKAMNDRPAATERTRPDAPEVIECEAVPVDAPGRAAARAASPRRQGFPIMFWAIAAIVLMLVFKLAGLLIAGLVMLARSPGALLALAGGAVGWLYWRRTKRGGTRSA
jgi:hypothetical protein